MPTAMEDFDGAFLPAIREAEGDPGKLRHLSALLESMAAEVRRSLARLESDLDGTPVEANPEGGTAAKLAELMRDRRDA